MNQFRSFDLAAATAPYAMRNALAAPQGQQNAGGNAFAAVPGMGAGGGDVAHMEVAGRALGLNENDQAAALSEFLANGGQNLDPAVTAWCAAYVNATLAQTGKQGTNSLSARSFLDWGQPVDTPQRGDVAVFSRGDPSGWQGHVGFFEGYAPDGSIRVLGGNQGDAVSVANYPADRLLGFRRG